MKLSKLYANQPNIFKPVLFHDGLNVVFAEIRHPKKTDKDTHNLGKSTLGRLIDFTLLSKRNPEFFLFSRPDLFEPFVFFLELELENSNYLTIRRSVSQPTKICFINHQEKHQDFNHLADDDWNHSNVPFEKAKELLDGQLDLQAISPWHYRNALGYLIRSQDDYSDVFRLNRFRAKDATWKPYLAHILGFDSSLIQTHYDAEKQLSDKQLTESNINNELHGSIEDISKVEGLLLIKKNDLAKKQTLLDSFDFRQQDKEKTKEVVDEIDTEIAELNKQRYSLQQNRRKIVSALQDEKILFNPKEAEKLFNEAGVLFSGQLTKDFTQLIEFNKAITQERFDYLSEEKKEADKSIKEINSKLSQLGEKRSNILAFLSDTEVFEKYKSSSNELVSLQADIQMLEQKKEQLQKLQKLRDEIRALSEKCSKLQREIEQDVDSKNADQNSLFSTIRLHFSEVN